jgi:hypothetical protein
VEYTFWRVPILAKKTLRTPQKMQATGRTPALQACATTYTQIFASSTEKALMQNLTPPERWSPQTRTPALQACANTYTKIFASSADKDLVQHLPQATPPERWSPQTDLIRSELYAACLPNGPIEPRLPSAKMPTEKATSRNPSNFWRSLSNPVFKQAHSSFVTPWSSYLCL